LIRPRRATPAEIVNKLKGGQRGSLAAFCLGVRAARQAHREHRALAVLASDGHVSAHHARELAREGKAEPRPAVAARGQGIGLGEFLEQLRRS
jgi:hypothetical protein